MIDKLIGSPAFIDHWTLKWGDLLQANRKYLGEKGVYEFDEWIRESFAANKPYDKLVREILSARGSSYENPAANFFRVTRDAEADHGEDHAGVPGRPHGVRAMPRSSVRTLDAEPVLRDVGILSRRVGSGPAIEVGEEIVYDQREDFDMKHPKDGRVMKPAFIVPATYGSSVPFPPIRTAAMALAEWVTSKDNPFFAEVDRQSRVELFLRARDYRSGG